MKIIAVSGWKGSGKDTLANFLIKEFGFKRIGFADPLKDTVASQFGLSRESLDDQKIKESPILELPVSPKDPYTKMVSEFMIREFRTLSGEKVVKSVDHKLADGSYEFYGVTEAGIPMPVYWTRRALCILEGSSKRATNPDYWVNKAVQAARESGNEFFVISDLRYKNEIAALKIACTPADTLETVRVNRFKTSESLDPSERDLDDATFDYAIDNTGSLLNLEEAAIKIALKTKGLS